MYNLGNHQLIIFFPLIFDYFTHHIYYIPRQSTTMHCIELGAYKKAHIDSYLRMWQGKLVSVSQVSSVISIEFPIWNSNRCGAVFAQSNDITWQTSFELFSRWVWRWANPTAAFFNSITNVTNTFSDLYLHTYTHPFSIYKIQTSYTRFIIY